MSDDFLVLLKDAHRRAQGADRALKPFRQETYLVAPVSRTVAPGLPRKLNQDIHQALADISPSLADGYTQVYLDLADAGRVSWAGTAHEVREVLAGMLRILAPDDEIKAQLWFKAETADGRPSHKQRVRFILRQRDAGSTATAVAENAVVVEARVETLVRTTYTRASDAAHGVKGQTEVRRILGYFEAFAHDLLDLP